MILLLVLCAWLLTLSLVAGLCASASLGDREQDRERLASARRDVRPAAGPRHAGRVWRGPARPADGAFARAGNASR
jgi:hypothetical protein